MNKFYIGDAEKVYLAKRIVDMTGEGAYEEKEAAWAILDAVYAILTVGDEDEEETNG